MPKKGSVNADSSADHGETQIILNTETKPSLNAWKHGAYSNLGLLPGEDPDEYERFLEEVFLEWAPCGPTETDTVLSLANCMWRKSHLPIYATAARARRINFLVFDGRESFLWDLEDAQRSALSRYAPVHSKFREAQKEREKIAMPFVEEFLEYWHSRQKGDEKGEEKSDKKGEEKSCEKSKEPSAKNTEEKSEEKKKEKSGEKSEEKSGGKSKKKSKETEQLADELLELAILGDQMRPETLLEEIELGDRIDARIDRLVKRLLHLKTAKQMI
jgi:hypothetical protein